MRKVLGSSAVLATAVVVSSCGGGSSETGSAGTGRLTMGLVDAPVEANALEIAIKGMTLHSPGGSDLYYAFCADPVEEPETPADESNAVQFDDPAAAVGDEESEKSDGANTEDNEEKDEKLVVATECETTESRVVDLLSLTGGNKMGLFENQIVPAGHYPWIRLDLDDNQPPMLELHDGTVHPVTIPSAAQTGLKLNGGMEVFENADNYLMVDFDAKKSLTKAGQNYKLRPTLRLIRLTAEDAMQSLSGSWSPEEPCDSPWAYIYEAGEGEFDDMGSGNRVPEEVTEMMASEDGTGYVWEYVMPGDDAYEVAYTCQGNMDDPDADEEIEFVEQPDP